MYIVRAMSHPDPDWGHHALLMEECKTKKELWRLIQRALEIDCAYIIINPKERE